MTHIWICLSFPWWNVPECITLAEYRFLSSLPPLLGYKRKVAVSAGSASDSGSAHFMVATCLHLALFSYLRTYSFWWSFWRLNSAAPGTVCTYICRNNVYVSQNRHFLKAVHLKVKLIEPIFSILLLTLLLCMLNSRSQIWVGLTEAGVGKWLYSELVKSCQLHCSC